MPAANCVVEVEFTPGVWTDLSTRVDLEQPFSIKGGRSDPYSDVGPTTLTGLVLRNDDGHLTPGNAASPYFPNVRRNRRIRVKVVATSTVQRFLGYIDSWGVMLSTEPVTEARVEATDRFKILARTSIPSTVATLEASRLGAVFDCAQLLRQGSSQRVTGIQRPAPTATVTPLRGGFLTPLTEPPPGTRSGLHIGGPSGIGPLIYLSSPTSASFTPNGVGGWLRAPNGSTAGRFVAQFGTVATLVWGASGALTLNRIADDGTVLASQTLTGPWDDGSWHYFELRWTGTAATVLVDTTTATTSAGSSRPTPRWGAIGGAWNAATNTASLVAYADYAEPTLLSSATIPTPAPDPFGASTGNLTGEPISTRLARIMGYIGFTDYAAPTTIVPAGSQDISGSILDAAQALARTEGTWAFIDPADGLLKFGSRWEPATTTLTVDAEADLLGDALEWSDPDNGDVNEVTGQGSGVSFTATDAASVAALGKAATDVQVLTGDASYVQAAAEWRLAKALSPLPRVPQVTVDLLTGQTAGLLDDALTVTTGSRVRVTNLLGSEIGRTRLDLSVQGYELIIGLNEFALRLDTDRSDDPCGLLLTDDYLGRVAPAAGALTLNGAISAGATSISVASTAGNLLSTVSGDCPLWLQVDGETLKVTAITGASSPQTLTVQRGQEGTIAAAHASGAAVELHLIPTLAY